MPSQVPLCVDLDGTLVVTDTLHESLLALLRHDPFALLRSPSWLARGRAHFKAEVTKRAPINVDTLPYNARFVAFIEGERQRGRALTLVTGADERIARAVALKTGLFDDVIASNGKLNVTGKAKAGKGGFDYAGNSSKDLDVWAVARRAIVVHASSSLAKKAAALCEVEQVFEPEKWTPTLFRRVLRVHQWAKNLLLFFPLIASHHLSVFPKVRDAAIAFVSFCLCASGLYLMNDLLDLDADRAHPTKRRRPFASGQMSPLYGILASPILLVASLGLALTLPRRFLLALVVYSILTTIYTFRLKRFPILDVLILACLYALRVLAGGYATRIDVSKWLLAFSLFLFLSLAFAKRFTELRTLQEQGNLRPEGRGYVTGDLDMISTMGIASGFLSVLVLAFYVSNPLVTELYANPSALWFLSGVILYWISRMWLMAHRGLLHEDPLVFALKDKQSWLIAALILAIGLAALPK
jgi:4-hydroxybenzoate polyprenyltransferase